MNKLYLAYLGSESKERLIEDHEILLVVANSLLEAKEKLKQKTKLNSDFVHIDAIMEIKNIDGYKINLEATGKEEINKVLGYEELKKEINKE